MLIQEVSYITIRSSQVCLTFAQPEVFLHPQMSSLGTIKKTAGLGHFFILKSYIHVLMYGEPTHILQEIIQQDVGNK